MKKWVLVFLCLEAAFSFWWISTYFFSINQEREYIREEHAKRYAEVLQKAHDVSQDIWHRLSRMHTLEEWEELAKIDISALSNIEQRGVDLIIKSKLSEMLFWRAETLLARARGLLEQDENNTMADAYIGEARAIYGRVKKFIPDIGEIQGDSLWNARLHYLKGAYYARSLAFIKNIREEKSKAEDAVASAVANLDKVFLYAPKDWDTQVAIEVLQKKAKDVSSSSAAGDKKLELQLFPGKDKEVGPFQIGPREEGKY